MYKQPHNAKKKSLLRCDFRIKTMFGSSLPPVGVEGFISYLRYLCLFAYNGVQHILCCVFVFFVLGCRFLWYFFNVYLRSVNEFQSQFSPT